MKTETEVSKHNRGSTPGNDSDEWRSPLRVVRAIERHFGFHFVADMAATQENAICPIYFTKEDNTLSASIEDIYAKIKRTVLNPDPTLHALWCNPPYGSTGLEPWIDAANRVSKSGPRLPWVFLLPASRSEQDWLYMRPPTDYHVTFLRRRVPYLRPDGTPGKAPNHPSFVLAFPGAGEPSRMLGGAFSHLDWKGLTP
ncbi:MAG: DNA N-6-adenine-methyltransferase [Fibrobacteria bacterium]